MNRSFVSAVVACIFCFGTGLIVNVQAQETAAKAKFKKVLFLGNSITKHGPKADIGWTGNWGMAASAEEKDFVHLVNAGLAKRAGAAPEIMVKNIAAFERQYATFNIDEQMKEQFAFGADLVILAIGENVPNIADDEAKKQFKNSILKLLNGLKAGKPIIVVRSCFWANGAKDQILKEACQEVGGLFVDIGMMGKDEANYARSEREFKNKGVAAHPGDKGMQAIAGAILGEIDKIQGK